MNFILFMLFSTLEMIAMYYLMFRVFKFELLKSPILFASVLSSFISYTMRIEFGFQNLDILLQVILMYLFVWLLFQVHPFYAGIMTAVTYVSYAAIQVIFYSVLQSFGLIPIVPDPLDFRTYLLQFLSLTLVISLGSIVHKRRLGFDFVPYSKVGKVNWNKINRILLLLYIPAFFVMSYTYYFLENIRRPHFYIILPSICILLVVTFIAWSYKTDRLSVIERLKRRKGF